MVIPRENKIVRLYIQVSEIGGNATNVSMLEFIESQ